MNAILMLSAIFLPMVAGIALPILKIKNRKAKLSLITAILLFELAAAVILALQADFSFCLLNISEDLRLSFALDPLARMFSLIAAGLWLPVGIYAFTYMTHEENEDRFFGFFLLVEGALLGMDYAANMVCMYFLFELMTFTALPLIIHNRSKESMAAGMKYLFYSVGGAFMGLLGIAVLSRYTSGMDFVFGGGLIGAEAQKGFLQAVIFVSVIGFGTKAGLYPMHGWLPSAHPVAPAPASAVLSAVIAKAGVLAIVRLLYYVVGPDYLRGTWVQYALLILAMLTVFMGSMMAFRENLLKKRLAYSTVSQISYVLIGVFLLTSEGLLGGLLHVVFHAVIKTGLFLVAGAIIFYTGHTTVDALPGIGKKMPKTIWGFTFLSLALVGIPPASGFVSKWYLAMASLDTGIPVINWLAPVILLVSALLTAGYLLPITVHGFFPGKDFAFDGIKTEKSVRVWGAVLVLAILSVALGIWAGPLVEWISAAVLGIGG